MGIVKKVVMVVALGALSLFSFGFGVGVAMSLGLTGIAATFVALTIGAIIVAAGSMLLQAVLGGGASKRAPTIEASKATVKVMEPERWLHAGRARAGGGVLFAEFDTSGSLWVLVVHSDEILHAPYTYYLDDIPVTLDFFGYVNEKEFRLKPNSEKDPATFDGEGQGYVRIWTTTYSETNPTPPGIFEFKIAMPQWTDDHKLVGTTYSVMKIDPIERENRHKIFRWRGPLGLGEPALSVAGDWANAYDPRDEDQTLGDRSTYKPSRNPAILWAWFRTHPFGRNKSEDSINWDRIAEQADICDQLVVGEYSTQLRYEAGLAFVDSKRRVDAEIEIMLTCDGQIVFDEDGKSWLRVGHWYTPTLSFNRNRDIMAMQSSEAQDGESETQGVIVRYMDPDAKYSIQPSAAWLNPIYYDPLTTPKFLYVDIHGCQNHNQAMRLAKGIGLRSQPRHKIGPTLNLRGLQARHERIVTINYDNTFAGDYEIAMPVELDAAGIFTGIGAVPVDEDRWTLLPGEEKPKPVVDGSGVTVTYPAIAGETITVADSAIRIDFPALPRPDAVYVAEYIPTSEITGSVNDPWIKMTTNGRVSTSGVILQDTAYTVRYRYITGNGYGPDWETASVYTGVALLPATNLYAIGLPGQVELGWKNPNDLRFTASDIYRGTTTVFADAELVIANYGGGVGQERAIIDNVDPGHYFYWVDSVADMGLSALAGPVDAIAT